MASFALTTIQMQTGPNSRVEGRPRYPTFGSRAAEVTIDSFCVAGDLSRTRVAKGGNAVERPMLPNENVVVPAISCQCKALMLLSSQSTPPAHQTSRPYQVNT